MQQIVLNESTAARRRIPLPQCVSDADGVTPITGLSFAAADIKVSENGAAEANSGGSVVEIASGYYYYEATTGEVDTRGFLQVRLNKSGVRVNVALAQIGAELNNATGLLVLADGVETGLTVQQFMQVGFAALGGKSDGAGTGTTHYRNKADTVNRITATITSNNRSAVSYVFS